MVEYKLIEQAMKAPIIAELPYSDFEAQVKKLIEYSFKYIGLFDDGDEKEFLTIQTGKLIQDKYRHLTMNEVGLAVRWGLDGQIRGAFELNLRSMVIWLSQYSVLRYKYFHSLNSQLSIETMYFLLNNLDKMPSVKQWYEEGRENRTKKQGQPHRMNDIPI